MELVSIIVLLVFCVLYQILVYNKVVIYYPELGFTPDPGNMVKSLNLYKYGVIGLGDDPSHIVPDTMRPPLFPVVAAAVFWVFGPKMQWILIINNIFFFASVFLTFLLGRRIHPWGGIFAALFIVADPIYLQCINAVETDALFHLLITWLLLHVVWMLQSGITSARVIVTAILIALEELTRPIGMYVWVAVCAIILIHLWGRVKWTRVGKWIAIVLVIHFATIGLWTARNVMVGGLPLFAGVGIYNFWNDHFPRVEAARLSIPLYEAEKKIHARFGPGLEKLHDRKEKESYMLDACLTMLKETFPWSFYIIARGSMEMFLGYPIDFNAVFYNKESVKYIVTYLLQESYYAASWNDRMKLLKYLSDGGFFMVILFGVISKIFNAILLIFGVAGAIRMIFWDDRVKRDVGLFLIMFVGIMTLIASTGAIARFRIPIMPAINVLAIYGILSWWERKRSAGVAAPPIQVEFRAGSSP
ncbi:MAG: glycosyltransferase family 39 protein [Magnetococcales bacterium]|nr:glycosyltransferase family 39 protein [Magnetococcales bacterium]MBF0321824.1 glycosyltransferase family 39 protein [Magnetococcales bacterium]